MFYNVLTEKIILPLSDLVLKSSLLKTFQVWKGYGTVSRASLDDLQLKKLQEILEFTAKNVAYYTKKNIVFSNDPKEYLSHFPILTKDILRSENLMSVESTDGLVKRSSSGSSGVPSAVYMSNDEVSRIAAIQALWWSWSGFRFGDKIVQMGNNPKRGLIKKVKDIVLRFQYEDGFSLSEEDIIKLLGELRESPRAYLLGYASVLYSIARTAEKYNITDISFTSVLSLGDKMFDHYRKTIEKQFSTQVYDSYGCSEGLMMSGQCEAGNYHIMTPHVYMEILDDEGNEVKPGEIGHVVATRLDATTMPLIRYKLGDLAVKSDPDAVCSCGRNFPLLSKVIGRETDLLQLASGKFATVHSFTGIFEYFNEIYQFQVLERDDGIMIRYIPTVEFSEDILDVIKERIYKQIDDTLKIEFRKETVIEPTASGKPCIVMSKEQAEKYWKDIAK